jgi:hypothetical protein
MATISDTPRPGYAWDATDNCWYPIGTGPHTHPDYITQSTAINPTIVDAKGDIIAATAADTVARLAVGANDTVLTADSSAATGLKWVTPAGSITLLTTTNLSGVTTTVSGISGAYTNLIVRIDAPKVTAVGDTMTVRFNGVTGSSYEYISINTSTTTWSQITGTRFAFSGLTSATSVNTKYIEIFISDYANASTKKYFQCFGQDDTTRAYNLLGCLNSAGAITSVSVFDNNNDTFNGGTIKIYGVK